MKARMRRLAGGMILLALRTAAAHAQAVNDPDVDIHVMRPAFPQNGGPVVAVDAAHNNYHTTEGRYAPFAALLRNDGFRVLDSEAVFTRDMLLPVGVLVIANALSPVQAKKWNAPASSAFSPDEIAAVRAWVMGGGSLLLIADHRPFAGSARDLAQAFGFLFEDGVVEPEPMDGRRDIFRKADGTLRDDIITRGRSAEEVVTAIRTFTGSAFQAPREAHPLLVFSPDYKIHECGLPCPSGVPTHDAAGYMQGAVMPFGKGRIAVFGEAGMFSAQVLRSSNLPFHFGFGAPGAEQNRQFILNLVRWLAGALPQ
jgi:hypothetical protein